MNVQDATTAASAAHSAATETAAALQEFETKVTDAQGALNAAFTELEEALNTINNNLEVTQTVAFGAHEQVRELHQDAEAKGYNSRFPLAQAAEGTESAIGLTAQSTDTLASCTGVLDQVRNESQQALAILGQMTTDPAAHITGAADALATAQNHLQAAGDSQ